MGWRFPIEYGNIAAYVTSSGNEPPPRITASELREFLGCMQGEYRDKPPLFSSDPLWIAEIVRTARNASKKLESPRANDNGFLDAAFLESVLHELKFQLGNYDLFGLLVGRLTDSEELEAFGNFAARSSRHHALILIPDFHYRGGIDFSLMDPFPAMRLLAEQPSDWPGVLFWTRAGAAAFASIDDANRLYQECFEVFGRNPRMIDEILRSYRPRRSHQMLLHLSDLHFGAPSVSDNEAYLSARLHEIAPKLNRVVITGDLFNNPKREEAMAFRNFRASLARLTGKDTIVIPGNHDQRWSGIGYSNLGELANLEWSNLVIDDEMQCVFFCFDSSRDADLSRGKVTTKQMVDVATMFETKAVMHPQIRKYLHVALIHHHPFSFETSQETWLQQLLSKFGLTDEYFLRMENGEEFVSWCAKRGISLILHGHKHVQRHVKKKVTYQEGRGTVSRSVTSVGCGSSLGVENYPITYNVLGWDPASKCWSTEFFADPGDGSGFTQQYISIQTLGDS